MSETPLEPTTYQKPRGVPQAAVGRLNAGRIATYATAGAGLLTAITPVIAGLDITSTVGLVGGMGAIAAVVVKWLDGWTKYEQDVRNPDRLNQPAP